MEEVLKQLASTLRSIHAESYYGMNRKKSITYPYITYTVAVDGLERNQDNYVLDIDIFGRGTSPLSVVKLEEKLKDKLEYLRELTEELNLVYSFGASMEIPTLVPDLHRRNITFNVKVDERNKQYGVS